MKFGNRVVVAVDLNLMEDEQSKMLRDLPFLKNAEVHFVHIFQTSVAGYSVGIGEVIMIYPNEADKKILEESILNKLVGFSQEAVPGAQGKLIQRCLFSDNPKAMLCEYADDIKADTIVVMSRQRHGFFESSFAQYVGKHSKCHLVTLKP